MKSWKVYLKYNTNLEKQFQLIYFVNTYLPIHVATCLDSRLQSTYIFQYQIKKLIGTYIRGCQIDNAEPYLQFFKFDMPTGSTTNIVIWTSYYLQNQMVLQIFKMKAALEYKTVDLKPTNVHFYFYPLVPIIKVSTFK